MESVMLRVLTVSLLCCAVEAPALAAAGRDGDAESPVHLFIQGKLRPGQEETYARYVEGTGPLLREYDAEVLSVGAGVESEHTSAAWPINAVLSFPDRARAEGFLADPRYQRLKTEYRDVAYEELHLSFVAARAPRLRTPRDVAEDAFGEFRRGLASGEWGAFLTRLDDDFVFHFPSGRYQGEHRGKAKAEEFFAYVSEVFSDGIEITEVDGITVDGERAIFEFKDRGTLFGEPYRNRVVISLDLCGERICAYREYFGLVGPPPEGGATEAEP